MGLAALTRSASPARATVARIRARQRAGELDDWIDPAASHLIAMSAASALLAVLTTMAAQTEVLAGQVEQGLAAPGR